MPLVQTQPDLAAIEQGVLDVIRGLLRELGSEQRVRIVAPNSVLERDLGLGSLERVELLVRCERRFGRRLPDEVAQQAETPADWVRALAASEVSAHVEEAQRERYEIAQPVRGAPEPPASARTWVEVLRYHAGLDPDRVQVHLLEGDSGQDISYGKLLETASQVAAGLRTRGLQHNDTVAIMLPTSSDFFYAFFGVMLAGGVAVPIYPPARLDKIEEYVHRQVKILRNAEVRFLISFDRARSVSQVMGLKLPKLLGVTSVAELARLGSQGGANSRTADTQPSEIAFIQYTSGSTGDPKGVVLTQQNVLANARGIGWAVNFRPDDLVVTWLPLYHDMGLIGSWLFSVYHGAPITVLSPLDFLSRPERWLWALHDSGGTLCPAPNFAYELCARKIRDEALEGLDLSRWRVAINAGEAVLPETLARFAERFRPFGFRPEAYVPCYGLAESSVALTFPPIDRQPRIDVIKRDLYAREGRAVPVADPRPTVANGEAPEVSQNETPDANLLRFVANGAPLPGHEVLLRDDEGGAVPERVQGRIWFRGLSRTPGYYRNPEATAAVVDDQGWMDSGDLGYWAGGELFVTGRAKDLIIRAGHNIVPQEVENAAAEVKGVRRGCVAAFGSREPRSGTERVVVVAETRESSAQEIKRIKAEIVHRVAAIGVSPDRVVLVPPQSIPKTSSGKIRRNETRHMFETGTLGEGARAPWLQMMRLVGGNVDAWIARRGTKLAFSLRGAYYVAASAAVSSLANVVARMVPCARRARVAKAAAGWLLRLGGAPVKLVVAPHTDATGTAVFVANRAGSLDALILAGVLPQQFLLADPGEVKFLPRQAAGLLRHLTLDSSANAGQPAGWRLRDNIRQALEAGHSVLVLSDSAPGAPAVRSRYRLDAFHAAALTGSPLVPVGLRGTAQVLGSHNASSRREARVTVGRPIDTSRCDQRELVDLRDRARAEIAELCR